MSVVVEPGASAAFTPRELADAYRDFVESGPQYVDDETGIKARAYRYGERVLFVYEEGETGLVTLVHPTWRPRSPEVPTERVFQKSGCTHST